MMLSTVNIQGTRHWETTHFVFRGVCSKARINATAKSDVCHLELRLLMTRFTNCAFGSVMYRPSLLLDSQKPGIMNSILNSPLLTRSRRFGISRSVCSLICTADSLTDRTEGVKWSCQGPLAIASSTCVGTPCGYKNYAFFAYVSPLVCSSP